MNQKYDPLKSIDVNNARSAAQAADALETLGKAMTTIGEALTKMAVVQEKVYSLTLR